MVLSGNYQFFFDASEDAKKILENGLNNSSSYFENVSDEDDNSFKSKFLSIVCFCCKKSSVKEEPTIGVKELN